MKRVVYILFLVSLPVIGLAQNKPVTKESNPFNGENVYAVVDEMPEFPEGESGLLRFYRENSPHPVVEKDVVAAVVYYQIVIDEKGKPTQLKILKGQSENLNEITKDLISKMPNWKPGIKDGLPVKVAKTLSIRFATLD